MNGLNIEDIIYEVREKNMERFPENFYFQLISEEI